jgi:hypothetical protein
MIEAPSAASAAFKSAVPVAVSGLSLMGIPLQEWVYIATLCWIAYQFGASVYDRVKGK